MLGTVPRVTVHIRGRIMRPVYNHIIFVQLLLRGAVPKLYVFRLRRLRFKC